MIYLCKQTIIQLVVVSCQIKNLSLHYCRDRIILRCHPAWRIAPSLRVLTYADLIYVGSFRLTYSASQSVELLYAVAQRYSHISVRPQKSIQPYIIRRDLTIRSSLHDKG